MEAHSSAKRQEAYRMWESGEKKSVIARTLQIDYDALLGWIKRFKAEGLSGMELRYHRCGRTKVIDDKIKAKALALRQAHAGWGCPYIRLQLVQEFGASAVPSVRHIQRWLKAADLIEPKTRLAANLLLHFFIFTIMSEVIGLLPVRTFDRTPLPIPVSFENSTCFSFNSSISLFSLDEFSILPNNYYQFFNKGHGLLKRV